MYEVLTEPTGWSYIIGPDSYREGPIRYRWEAEEWADEMNSNPLWFWDDAVQPRVLFALEMARGIDRRFYR